jgi:hypothetical protein
MAKPPPMDAGSTTPAPAPSPALAHRVRALQRSAGNAAVRRLLTKGQPARTRPRASITVSVRPGGLARWMPRRPTRLLKGDVLVVRARVEGVVDPSESVTPLINFIRGGLKVVKEGWRGGTYEWRIRAESVGEFPLDISLWHPRTGGSKDSTGDGMSVGRDQRLTFGRGSRLDFGNERDFGRVEPLSFGPARRFTFVRDGGSISRVFKVFAREITVLGDIGNQHVTMTRTMSELDDRFDVAGRELDTTAMAFTTAFRRYDEELKAVEAGVRHDSDMAWGILFAGLGGFVGGAVGGLVKPQVEKLLAKAGLTGESTDTLRGKVANALREGLTDAAKDPSKFGVRVTGRSYPGVTGDSIAPPGSHRHPPPRPKHLEDPLLFYIGLQTALKDEKRAIRNEVLTKKLDQLDAEAARNSRALFTEDPVAMVSTAIDQAYPEVRRMRTWTKGDWDRYYDMQSGYFYEQLWGAWVKANYYKIRVVSRATQVPKLGGAPYRYEVDTPPWRMDRQLRRVAEACGYPDLHAFLAKYGDYHAKAKAARGNLPPSQIQ